MRISVRYLSLRLRNHTYRDRCSILSVSAFQVGHAKRNGVLRNRGVELYSEAIRIMSRALKPSQLARRGFVTLDLEMAGYALALYEVSLW